MKNLKLLYDLLVRTNNPVECGIACIQTVAKYYGYLCSIDELKHTSRMSESGMTLLELSKIAKNIGFSAKAYRTDFETIIGIDSPLVLNTISKSGQNGYVVMLGTTEKKGIKRFIIGDPLHGVYFLSQKQLEERWYSRICLILEVTKKLELSDLAVKPKLIINHLMSEKKLWRLMLFITLIQTLVLTIGIILALRLLDVILFPDILRLASLSQALEVFIIFIIYLFFDSFRTYISKIYSLKMLGVFQYEYHNYLLGMSKSYLSNQNKDSLTAQGLNNISQMMKYLTKVIKGIPYFFAFPIVLITLTIRSWEILLVGTPIFALLHIWYYRKRILLSYGYYASVAHVGTSIVSFFEFVENLGLYKSFKSSSTILYNSTQWFIYPYIVQQKEDHKIHVLKTFTAFLTICIYFLIAFFNYLRVVNFDLSGASFLIDISTLAAFYFLTFKCSDQLFSLHISDHFFNKLYYLRGVPTGNVINRDQFNSLQISNLPLNNPSEKGSQIKEISLTIYKDEMIGVVCDNSFEKRKICKILIREDECDEMNEVLVNGKAISTISLQHWKSIITLVPQEPKIFKGSIIENITFYDSMYSPEKVRAFLSKTHLDLFFRHMPSGYHTTVSDDGAELSRAEKHIISVLRAVYANSAIILVDDIFIDLDGEQEKYCIELLKNMTEDRSIILLSVNENPINKYCDRNYLIESM
ncbi:MULTISPECIES: cysteine peptidase family C39 domain-containing protein [Bacteroidota]|nr:MULTISPECIES: cysteine peptidase family C39 domain-containing protein [Bacteroidota]